VPHLIASIIECCGLGVYCVIFWWLGLQSLAKPSRAAIDQLMRLRYVLALSLGIAVVALAVNVWMAHGRFAWADFPGWGQLTLALLLALLLSNLVLEFATLQPIRSSTLGSPQVEPALLVAQRHLLCHCVLAVGLWLPWLATLF
tara:strand:+ start:225 stop:656 length:432 start_codon:yes stop_codon:yes gene_type:complete